MFVPGVPADRAIALLQDYDHHAEIYKPTVAKSKLLNRNGDTFRVNLRFHMKKVITVVVDGEHEARFTRASPTRGYSRIASTRLTEIDNPATPDEKEKPVGQDGGYLWRINSYWRFLERDGGTDIQCETITLSRGIPVGLARPKSRIFTAPEGARTTFSGFRSRWTTPCACAAARARASCPAISSTWPAGSGPSCSSARNDRPGTCLFAGQIEVGVDFLERVDGGNARVGEPGRGPRLLAATVPAPTDRGTAQA